MKKILILIIVMTSLFCNTSKDENKAKLAFPEVAYLLSNNDTIAYFYTREIDKTLTINCGIATPGITTTGTPGTPGSTTTPTTGTTSTTNSKFTILSQLTFSTGETLTMKFQYDSTQFQGTLDQQQGFTLTGGIFGHTVKGTRGTVKWSGQGIGYIDEATKTAQTLTFMIIDLNLTGTFTPGVSGSTSTPVECNTTDGINCTSTVSTTKCFTQDFKTCISNSTSGSPITISGSINCNAPNVIPQ